jgi:hypothetical protein
MELPAPLIQADVENLGKKERENIRVNFCEKFLTFLHISFFYFYFFHSPCEATKSLVTGESDLGLLRQVTQV